jgi:hypothetical protein
MGWAPRIHTKFHELRVTLERLGLSRVLIQDCHLLWLNFPEQFTNHLIGHIGARTPVRRRVWAVPLSLAATYGIAFAFFSSAY